ncbi:MAG: hypothetical protein JST53_02400 [Actinobacteria bacterium]|nr:hypothetical protein [Actinomycetota bacterium]
MALHANDCTCRRDPDVPVRLYFSSTEQIVAPLNTRHCATDLRAPDGAIEAVDLGRVQHPQTIAVAAPRMLGWPQAEPSTRPTR